jgi:hypothetical protein
VNKDIDEEDDDKGIDGFCGQLAFVVHLGLKKSIRSAFTYINMNTFFRPQKMGQFL